MSATAHFITVTAADRNGDVALHARTSTDLPGDGILNAVGCLLMAELKKGAIDPKLTYDAGSAGTATVTAADDGDGGAHLTLTLDPPVDLQSGKLSGAQALTLTAVARAQQRLRLEELTRGDVTAEA
jgi:adhesin HecA-like repeat protein